MGDKITLKLDTRAIFGKKVAGLRRDGLTPAVVYGAAIEPTAVSAVSADLNKVIKDAGFHTPIYLDLSGKKRIAMVKDVDIDPVKQVIRHVAFHAVRQNQPVEAEVPIRLVGEGENPAERAGLIVLQTLESIEVKALPLDLPEALEVSIEKFEKEGDRVTVGDIKLPEGVEVVDNDDGRADNEDEERTTVFDLMVASVYEPSALQAANEAAAGEAEDESEVDADNGSDTDQSAQDGENQPGGKAQDEPK